MPRVAKEKSKHAKTEPDKTKRNKVKQDEKNRVKAKKNKLKQTKTNQRNIETETKDDKFSFDEEIVIGLKRIDEPKVVEKKAKKPKKKVKTTKKNEKNRSKIKSNSKIKNLDNDSGVIIKSKYMQNYEEDEESSNYNNKQNNKKNKVNQNSSRNIKREPKKLTKKQEISRRKRKKVLRIIKYLTLFAIIIGGIIYTLLSPIFNIKNIEVYGNSKISSDTIISLSGLKIDQNIFSFWTSDIRDAIKQNAYIDKVQISRKIPDKIEISVQERVTTYMLTLGNAYVYINNQGYILEITSKKLEVPVIIGYNTPAEEIVEGNRLNETDLEKLNDVLKIMEATSSGESEIDKLITQIDISDKNNYILDLSSEKKKIYLGDVTDLSTKVLWINKILKDEEKNEGIIYLNVNLNVEEPYFREKV